MKYSTRKETQNMRGGDENDELVYNKKQLAEIKKEIITLLKDKKIKEGDESNASVLLHDNEKYLTAINQMAIEDGKHTSTEDIVDQLVIELGKRKAKGKRGGNLDPSLNQSYCDGHISQCQDYYSTCQDGGYQIDPSINPSFCDTHNSQCQDSYSSCGGGKKKYDKNKQNDIYNQYKQYKRLYKNLKAN